MSGEAARVVPRKWTRVLTATRYEPAHRYESSVFLRPDRSILTFDVNDANVTNGHS